MKTLFTALFLFALSLSALPVVAQQYKTAGDTARLNKEYTKLVKDIAELNEKLTKAQNDLPAYEAKARDAEKDAADATSASSDQASKVNSGNVKDAKRAKRKADKAYEEAKDYRAATNKLKNLQDKISRYEKDLAKKQQRLQELDTMRAAIYNTIPPGTALPQG